MNKIGSLFFIVALSLVSVKSKAAFWGKRTDNDQKSAVIALAMGFDGASCLCWCVANSVFDAYGCSWWACALNFSEVAY